MPVTNDAQLPIGRLVMSGPAVEERANRRETNNHPEVTIDRLRKSYRRVKAKLFSDLKLLEEKTK